MPSRVPEAYGPSLAALLRQDRLQPLGAGSPDEAMRPALAALTIERSFTPRRRP